MDDVEYKPRNVETDPLYNTEGGIVVIPGSNLAKEYQKFEQFPSKWGSSPGNPYVYRPYPKMLYRAQEYQGKACCMAAPPDPVEFADPREFERADESSRKFSERCQRIVGNESERARAMEDGWRESPDEAVAYLLGKQRDKADGAAHRNYEDRNMSDAAKAEAKVASEDAGVHLPEVPQKPVSLADKAMAAIKVGTSTLMDEFGPKRRGRPKGSKNKPKDEPSVA